VGKGNKTRIRSTVTSETVKETAIAYLRQIPVAFRVSGLGAGEALASLSFDGINVNPGGIVANAEGIATGSFVIPAHVAAGTKTVRAAGAAGLSCDTTFIGEGRLETTRVRTTTVLERFSTAVVRRPVRRESSERDNDPQAQSFALQAGRFITSLDLRFCRIGNRAHPVDIDIVTMENGLPTQTAVATARISMYGVVANTWTRIRFDHPVYVPADTYVAFVVRTDDGEHSVSIANLGDFDAANQRWVSAQPYVIGDRFDGSNNYSWLVHPESDVTFRANAAVFGPASKTILLGTFAVTNLSDVLILADVILPEASCSVVFRVKIGPTIYTVAADQTLELTSYFTGTVTVSAVLTGDARVSPVLSRDINIVFGSMKTSGRYVGLGFTMGDPVQLDIVFSGLLPSGSTVSVAADGNNDVWTPATLTTSVPIDDGFTEYTYRIPAHSAPDGGRVRIDITGTPAARPAVSDLRAFTF
ncbi:MAG: hypothetical protein QMD99_10460, partial [Rhizobiaceae bacterium]|nr:hypothetical protein [Rhizobiaceae bacterium]